MSQQVSSEIGPNPSPPLPRRTAVFEAWHGARTKPIRAPNQRSSSDPIWGPNCRSPEPLNKRRECQRETSIRHASKLRFLRPRAADLQPGIPDLRRGFIGCPAARPGSSQDCPPKRLRCLLRTYRFYEIDRIGGPAAVLWTSPPATVTPRRGSPSASSPSVDDSGELLPVVLERRHQ